MYASQSPLRTFALAALLACASLAQAQSAPAVDADKQKLIDQILTVWHPENTIVIGVQRPASEALEKSKVALEQARLPQPKVEAAMKDISTDVQKYVDTVTPLAIGSAKRNLQTTVVQMLAQNFSVDELKQLLAQLQSPIKAKFDKLTPEAALALAKKVQEQSGPEINKDIEGMQKAVGTKLRIAITAASN